MRNVELEAVADACGGAIRTGAGWLCKCPAHDDRTPSLSLSVKGDKLLAYCHAGCSFKDVLEGLKLLGYKGSASPDASYERDVKSDKKTAYAKKLWKASRPARGTLVETYLRNRGYIGEIPPSIRFHPNLKHQPSGNYYPAMIAAVTLFPSDDICAIHRTFLNFDGLSKADVEPNKMMLGSVKGGAVMFGARSGYILWLAEGVETALSIFLATGQPTWATLSTSGMANVILPPIEYVPSIWISADHDYAGFVAATKLGDREYDAGRTVMIVMPDAVGSDFNDLLRR